jgi:hypothetical protein
MVPSSGSCSGWRSAVSCEPLRTGGCLYHRCSAPRQSFLWTPRAAIRRPGRNLAGAAIVATPRNPRRPAIIQSAHGFFPWPAPVHRVKWKRAVGCRPQSHLVGFRFTGKVVRLGPTHPATDAECYFCALFRAVQYFRIRSPTAFRSAAVIFRRRRRAGVSSAAPRARLSS